MRVDLKKKKKKKDLKSCINRIRRPSPLVFSPLRFYPRLKSKYMSPKFDMISSTPPAGVTLPSDKTVKTVKIVKNCNTFLL